MPLRKTQTALFVRTGSFSLINDKVYETLNKLFTNTEVEILDVSNVIKRDIRPHIYFINLFFFLKEYSLDFVKRQKGIRDLKVFYYSTSYFARKTAQAIRRRIKGKKYLFSLQTQSMINAKVDEIPNFVYTDHTTKTNLLYPDINPKQYLRSSSFIKDVETNIYHAASFIFSFGSLTSYSLQNQYGIDKAKVKTVFAGSNVEEHFVENKNKYHSKNILFVGVDWERKGGPTVLNVFKKLLEKYPDATLTIAGCNPEISDTPNCKVLGKQTADELCEYYNKAALFFMPTLREPFGVVFIEAMRYRLPCVSNNIGSLSDMITDGYNGYLIKNNDVDEYVNKISFLFDNPDLAEQMGNNGYESSKSNFTWEHVIGKMKGYMEDYLKVSL